MKISSIDSFHPISDNEYTWTKLWCMIKQSPQPHNTSHSVYDESGELLFVITIDSLNKGFRGIVSVTGADIGILKTIPNLPVLSSLTSIWQLVNNLQHVLLLNEINPDAVGLNFVTSTLTELGKDETNTRWLVS